MDEKSMLAPVHRVILQDRRTMEITGVTDIESFDEETVAVFTEAGELILRGSGLHIQKIDVESGNLSLEGTLQSLEYTDDLLQRGNLWTRLFR